VVLPFIALIAILAYLTDPFSSSVLTTSTSMSGGESSDQAAGNLASKLVTSLKQTSISPLIIKATVTNTHTEPITVLIWDTPLDPLAVKLGLVSIIPSGADEPLTLQTIALRRMMPPPREDLTTIGPGGIAEQELELREPSVPLETLLKSNKAKISCKGRWTSVWLGRGSDVSAKDLEDLGGARGSGGDLESDTVEISLRDQA
jgi:hypothetical protein